MSERVKKIQMENGVIRYYLPRTIRSNAEPFFREQVEYDENGDIADWILPLVGVLHNDEGPAVMDQDGREQWYRYGKRHRGEGKPAVINPGYSQEYWEDGQLHRTEGPAITYDKRPPHPKQPPPSQLFEYPDEGNSFQYHIRGKKVKPKQRHEMAQLWNGKQWVKVEWNGTVLGLADKPDTLDNQIWVYDENYNPLYRPNIEEIRLGQKPAATLHDINEGLPDPKTGLKQAQLKEVKNPLVFYKNYDYGTGPDEKMGPGKGLYENMDKYKSVADFLKKKRKKNRRRRKTALLLAAIYPELVEGKRYKTALQDPYEDQNITPLAPISPAEVNPIGMLDGIYPKSDLEGKTVDNLYYGILETHEYAASDHALDDINQAKDNYVKKHVDEEGTVRYYDRNDQLHRTDGPAIEFASGGKEWYRHGKLHRDNDEPAIIWSDGTKQWYQNGDLHRDNDKPAIEYKDGEKQWYRHGLLHRENGPAVDAANGDKRWYFKGNFHREDGPAIEYSDGTVEYWYHGVEYPETREEVVKLWGGSTRVIVEWNGLVLHPANLPNTMENQIWVYDHNYNPLYRPKINEIKDGKVPAATLHDINEGLPDPHTGLKDTANIST